MNSLKRNSFTLKNRNIIGIQNKEELISLISRNSMKENKLRALNTLDKNSFINNKDIKVKKSNNDSKFNNTNSNLLSNKRIFNKFLINQIKNENKKEKEFIKTEANIRNLQNLENIKTIADKNNISINNISSYKTKNFPNENNNRKKNYAMKAHHLINYLLKNQNKNPKQIKTINNELELSLSSSFDNNKKELSPSKDLLEKNNNNDKNKRELFHPKNIKGENKINSNKKYYLYNSINHNENNIYSGENKENKDINLVNNKKELLISPLYNLSNNNNDSYKDGNKIYKSPLRMADIFSLKKHHSLNPQLKTFLSDNNKKDSNYTFNKIKTFLTIKKENDNEKSVGENIKRIQSLKVNTINIEKENTKNKIYGNKYLKKEKENKISKEDNKKINEKKNRNEIKEKLNNGIKDVEEKVTNINNRYNRNDKIGLSKRKYFSQTLDNIINKTNISLNNSKIDYNLKRLSPIKAIKDTKKNIKEDKIDKIDSVNNMRIKVNKINLGKIKEEVDENDYKDKFIYSIRRRFMNSKNKYNNNQTPEFQNKKVINIENITVEKNIKSIRTNEIKKKISETTINNSISINKIKGEVKENIINGEILKNEEVENIPEIKFQSESEKENRIKRAKKYRQKKEKMKEKENKIIIDNKKEERNPRYKLRKHNSFSFGTLFSLSEGIKQRKSKVVIKEKINKKEEIEEKWKSKPDDKIINRNFSPDLREINKNKLNILFNEKEMKLKGVNSEKNIHGNIKMNLIRKARKKVVISNKIKIEEFITTKPVVRFKISELLYNNKLNEKLLNNNNNPKKNNELFIFGLDKNNLIKFDIRKKRYHKIKISDIEDISDSFQNEYIYENILISNTLTGIFILTGKNANILYYYDKKYEFIIKLCQFTSNHNSGCLLLDKYKIFIFSGINNKKCEYYDLISEKIKSIPQLNYDRANSSFCFAKNNIYAFFGYSYIMKDYLFNIEYIDKNKLDKWNEINLNIKENILINNNIINASLFYYDKEPDKIFIYGGKNGINNDIIEGYYFIYDIEKNNFEKIENLDYKIKKEFKRFSTKKYQEESKKYFFDKQKQFIELPEHLDFDKNNENICATIDYDNNIHFLTNNRNQINLYQFLK